MVTCFNQRMLYRFLIVNHHQCTHNNLRVSIQVTLFNGSIRFLPVYLIRVRQSRLELFVRFIQTALH